MENLTPEVMFLLAVGAILILSLPVGYYVITRSAPGRSLLLVSTDPEASALVSRAARRAGYRAVHVYRYEDGLELIRRDPSLLMIVVDDSVPQYEAGMMLSMLQRSPIGARPLIIIQDSSEPGLTTPSYQAEVVSRPLTEKALEAAIRKIHERIEPLLF